MFKNNKIVKVIKVNGMSCEHCSKKIEKALKGIKNVNDVKVDLINKNVKVVLKEDISNDILKSEIEDLGYIVMEI